jgi:hypothetical protein
MPTLGTGTQSITLIVDHVPAATKVMAERVGIGTFVLEGEGDTVYGTLQGEPARFLQLRLFEENQGRHQLFDGVLPLTDANREVLAFEVVDEGPRAHALRVPDPPVAAPDVAVDPRTIGVIRYGWGVLVLAYVAALVSRSERITEEMRTRLSPAQFRRWIATLSDRE